LLFNSLTFLAFFAVVLAVLRTGLSWSAKKAFLAGASWFFYAAADPALVLVLIGSTFANWALGLWIAASEEERARSRRLLLGVAANTALLGVFKYAAFAVENLATLAQAVGVEWRPAAPQLPLPIGVSFITFQSIAYLVDVRKRQVAAERSPLDYAVFAAYFPHLVAGPIVRAGAFLPQLKSEPRPTAGDLERGLLLLVAGLFQKLVLADAILAPVADKIFEPGVRADAFSTWTGVFAFTGQIFCDFGGYTTAAIGVASVVGLKLTENFKRPYAAITFSDFWRRWHVSLSSWLRDYLYLPLGGARKGEFRTYLNLMVVMLLGGLWHGANWTFVVWGGLNGVFLAVERVCGLRDAPAGFFARHVRALITLTMIAAARVFFRAPDFGAATEVLRGMVGLHDGRGVYRLDTANAGAAWLLVAGIVIAHRLGRDVPLENALARVPRVVLALGLAGAFLSFLLLSRPDRAFIYFQF
jgi:alginate O-acetyltransferase complex protein AlgI